MQINSNQHFHSYSKARRRKGKHYIRFRKQVPLQKYGGLLSSVSFSFQQLILRVFRRNLPSTFFPLFAIPKCLLTNFQRNYKIDLLPLLDIGS